MKVKSVLKERDIYAKKINKKKPQDDQWTLEMFRNQNEDDVQLKAVTKSDNALTVCKNDSRRFWQFRGGESTKEGSISYELLVATSCS